MQLILKTPYFWLQKIDLSNTQMETKQTRGLGALSRRAKLALTLTQPFEEDPNSNSDLGSGSDYGLLLLRELLARIASLAGREDKKKNARNLGSPPGLFVHRPEIEELERGTRTQTRKPFPLLSAPFSLPGNLPYPKWVPRIYN